MGACPFCGATVGDDILVNGGHCPSCLIEIPGEETPTDPGEEARAQQAAAEEAAGGGGKKVAVLALLGVLVVGVGGWMAMGPTEADTQPMQIEMGEFSFAPVSAHEDLDNPADEQEDEAVADAGSARQAPRSGGTGGANSQAVASANTTASAAPPSGRGQPTASAGAPPPTGGQLQPEGPQGDPLDAMFFGDGPSQKGVQGIVLCKPGEIYEGVRSVMKVKSPQLGQCYQRALKANEGLRGKWQVSFVVQKTGKPASIKAVGQGVSDSTLETCVVTQVERWSFPQLCEATPIETPLSFGL